MKRKLLLITGVAVACFALAPATFAQIVNNDQTDNSMLYLPNVDLTSLSQNGFTGIVGGQFLAPYFYNVSVNYVGYADPTDVALVDSHTITLWDFSGNVVASAVVPSGTPTLWANGYAWVQLPSTVTLTYNNYYEVGATVVGGVDPWGDLISNNAPDNGNNGQITWNVSPNGYGSGNQSNGPFVQASSGYEFSREAEYDSNTSDAGNPNPSLSQTSAQDSIYPAANLGYNVVAVPEPTILGLLGMGTIALLGFTRRQKN